MLAVLVLQPGKPLLASVRQDRQTMLSGTEAATDCFFPNFTKWLLSTVNWIYLRSFPSSVSEKNCPEHLGRYCGPKTEQALVRNTADKPTKCAETRPSLSVEVLTRLCQRPSQTSAPEITFNTTCHKTSSTDRHCIALSHSINSAGRSAYATHTQR